ncbi:serine protease [bacterium]|nr:serine protease [bacterium]
MQNQPTNRDFKPLIVIAWIMSVSAILRAQVYPSNVVDDVRSFSITLITYDSLDNPMSIGCGFFIGGQGDIVTSRHVIKEASRVEILTSDRKRWTARQVVAEDIEADLIRLSVDIQSDNIHPLPIAGLIPEIGEAVVVIGPQIDEAKTSRKVLEGTISALREIGGFGTILEISTPVSPGFSGSPVVNSKGEVVGVTAFQLTGQDTTNYAVSSERIMKLVSDTSIDIRVWESERRNREPNSNNELYLKGMNFILQENWDAALACFDSIIEESPLHILAYPMKGYCNLKLERWDEAVKAYYQALMIDPTDAASYYDMALAYAKSEQWGEAMASYKQAIRLDSTNADSYCGLGIAYVNLDEWKEARECFRKASAINPNLASAHYGAGLTSWVLDDMDSAWFEYHMLEQLDKKMAEDLYSKISE